MAIRITLDTNVLISGLDGSASEQQTFNDLLSLRETALLDIGVSSRFDKDKERDQDLERVKRHYSMVRRFPVVPGPFRLDVSRLGEDVLVDETVTDQLEKLFAVRGFFESNSRTVWDIDHLYAHFASKRDYFLTYEKRILNKAVALAALGINVLSPPDFLSTIMPSG